MSGKIRLRVTCLTPERLLRRALDAGAVFTSIRRADARTLVLDTDPEGERILRGLGERYSIPFSVVRRGGVSAVAGFVKRRATLPAGILTAVVLCALFLGRVWQIDITFTGEGAARGDPKPLRRMLDEMQIRPGSPRPKDVGLIGKQLEATSGDYSFVGVRAQGVRLLVEAIPETPAPQIYDVDAARDLVSACDGIVVSAEARSGELCVSPGDTVRKGQLLIRGEEKASAGGTRPIAALGEVIVRTWRCGEAALPATKGEVRFTGRSAVSSVLRVFCFEIPIVRGASFESQREETRTLAIGGLFLPVQIVRRTYRETRLTQVDADPALLERQLRLLAAADAGLRLFGDCPDGHSVVKTWFDGEPASGGMKRMRAVYEIQTNAAVARKDAVQGG